MLQVNPEVVVNKANALRVQVWFGVKTQEWSGALNVGWGGKLSLSGKTHVDHCFREEYPDYAPSILSDAWLAIQGSRSLYMGSTWEWKSRNSNPNVSVDEASKALQELLPKVSAFYPAIKDWTFTKANAGLRAMPPLTAHGSLPLLGCVNYFVGENVAGKYWLFGGLGSRGLLYHAWLGNLMAQAVISCNEQLIPSELTAWKNINR